MTIFNSAYVNPRRPGTVEFADAGAQSVLSTGFSVGVNMNAAKASRLMIAIVYVHNGGLTVATLLDSISIAGVGMSQVGGFNNTAVGMVICTALVPTGTSGTLSMTHSGGTGAFFSFALWSAYDLASRALHSQDGGFNIGRAASVAVPFGGIAVAFSSQDFGGGAGSMSGTGWTQDFSGAPASCGVVAGSLTKQKQAGTRAGTFSVSSSIGFTIDAASFG